MCACLFVFVCSPPRTLWQRSVCKVCHLGNNRGYMEIGFSVCACAKSCHVAQKSPALQQMTLGRPPRPTEQMQMPVACRCLCVCVRENALMTWHVSIANAGTNTHTHTETQAPGRRINSVKVTARFHCIAVEIVPECVCCVTSSLARSVRQ